MYINLLIVVFLYKFNFLSFFCFYLFINLKMLNNVFLFKIIVLIVVFNYNNLC